MQKVFSKSLKEFLDKKVDEYNQPSFIKHDPVCIPHLFTKKQDIEIAGFFAAIFSWGNRTTIITKSKELMELMDNAPYQFITQHTEEHLKRLLQFKHRTFNTTDLLYFIQFFKYHYSKHKSLESAFFSKSLLNKISKAFTAGSGLQEVSFPGETLMGAALNSFYHYFFSLEEPPARTFKHIATPAKKSTCKRLNMFLRWMIRKDSKGVDLGIWNISSQHLICPIDVHVARVARHFKLLDRKPTDWQSAVELTSNLKTLDGDDPVKYDFALFGLGVMEKF